MKNSLTKVFLPLFLFLLSFFISYSLLELDFLNVLLWWFCILIIGLIFLPVSTRLFKMFFDKGYILSKILGLAVSTLALWILSMFRILPFETYSVFIVLFLSLIIVFSVKKGYKEFIRSIKENVIEKQTFLYMEIFFFFLLSIAAFVKGHNPSSGVEMPMDFAFLNNILNTKYFPPMDVWLSGLSTNYYYYGQYVFAFLTKMSGIDSSVTYNLSYVSLFAFLLPLTFSLTGSIIYNLKNKKHIVIKVIIAGLISSTLLTLGGNLHTVVYDNILKPLAQAEVIDGSEEGPFGEVNKEYYYPDPRSYVGDQPQTEEKTITEFPSYSLILGDLHAQIIDSLFVILFICLLYSLFITFLNNLRKREEEIESVKKKFKGQQIIDYHFSFKNALLNFSPVMIFMILVLPIMWMTNAWDFPIYIVVMFITFLYMYILGEKTFKHSIAHTFIDTLKIVFLSFLILIPFMIGFVNPTQGVRFVNLSHFSSWIYWFQLFVIWGYQLFFVTLFVIFVIRNNRDKERKKLSFWNKIKNWLANINANDAFILILCLCAVGLILTSELIYQKDVSVDASARANTVWKVCLQAFILFDIVVGYIFVRVISCFNFRKVKHYIAAILAVIFVIAPFAYTPYAIKQPYISEDSSYVSLDVMHNTEAYYPDDYNAMIWMRENIKGHPIILESTASSMQAYTDCGRYSSATGFPTLLGWYTHQMYWRGDGDKNMDELNTRYNDITTMYECNNPNETLSLIDEYNISYIVISDLERSTYENINEQALSNIGKIVYQNNSVKIIDVKQ